MKETLQNLIQRLHQQQSGAIALLLLAAILILFMCSLVIYDAGQAAADKMDAQIGADSSAFSHTVVKARSMNMISYANTIKRMIFSYLATYVNAWVAIILRWLYHAKKCFKLFPNIASCITWAKALPMIIVEGIELFAANLPSMHDGVPFGRSDARSTEELQALENYQQYMIAITPWWAYVEGVIRGMNNGALVTAAWPPPGSVVSDVKSKVASVVGSIDGALGTNLIGQLPSVTTAVDALPIARRDADDPWNNVMDPYNFGYSDDDIPILWTGIDYCIHYAFSLEALTTGIQTYLGSDNDPTGWKGWFTPLQLTGSVGCFFAAWLYNDNHYADYRLKRDLENKQDWLAATASTHISYVPHSGRNSLMGERRKYTYIRKEAQLDQSKYGNEGYFAMARSELVFKQPFEFTAAANGFLTSFGTGVIGTIAKGLSHRLGVHEEPDMWSPRWKSKNRPLILPGEQFGSAIQGSDAGLNTIINDSVPFLALGAVVGITSPSGDPPFTFSSAVRDFAYLLNSSDNWSSSRLEGLSK